MIMSASYKVKDSEEIGLSFQDKFKSESTRSDLPLQGAKTRTGLFIKYWHLFAFLIFVLLSIIAVALIVHFTAQKITCECSKGSSPADRVLNCQELLREKRLCSVPSCVSPPATYGTKDIRSTPPYVRTTPSPKPKNIRLPGDLSPYFYNLELTPHIYGDDPKYFNFTGSVTIFIKCIRDTSTVILHSKKLTYDHEEFKIKDSRGVEIKFNFNEDKKRQFLILKLVSNLKAGKEYTVTASFSGPLRIDLQGLYLSSYKRQNKTIYLATTQLQTTDARKVFPCFDEPAIKAKFNVTLLRKPHMHSLSNMHIIRSEKRPNGFIADVYDTTVKMSTYLLAFIICDFEPLSAVTSSGVNITVWARKEFINQTHYALNASLNMLPFFEQYYKISYPLSKLDMIGVPDFSAGAMENWGLIIYRESSFLYDPEYSPVRHKRRVALIVAHELAHMWFGNLVTLSWWDDTWLNEGFASYAEYLGVDQFEKSWDFKSYYRILDTERAMIMDSVKNSHPIYAPILYPSQIEQVFSAISYAKGGHIIRMMEYFMGTTVFQTALTKYLKKYEYSDANHTKLWDVLSNYTSIDVNNVMATWIQQMNYPLVTLNKVSTNQIEFTQQRFLSTDYGNESSLYHSNYNFSWYIPLTLTTKAESKFNSKVIGWLEDNQKTYTHTLKAPVKSDDWIISNLNNNGFYRVNYDDRNWELLIKQLQSNHKVIPVTDRNILIYDSCKLARYGYISYNICLDILSIVDKDEDYVTIAAALQELGFINRMLIHTDIYGLFLKWVKKVTQKLYDKLDFSTKVSGLNELSKRRMVVLHACTYGYGKCLKKIQDSFNKGIMAMNETLDPNIIESIYCFGIKLSDSGVWDKIYGDLDYVSVAKRKYSIPGLACSDEIWILHRYVKLSLTQMKRQDAGTVFSNVAHNPLSRFFLFNFFSDNFHTIFESFGELAFTMTSMIDSLTTFMNTPQEMVKMQNLINKLDKMEVHQALRQAVAKVKSNINWMDRNKDQISDWLNSNQK